ncbi:hypothetical protein CIB48_g11124 [Xylaria polymorpha]|nr:hypothetical protein CIB48_g11124 [Xylaria polymorpha]
MTPGPPCRNGLGWRSIRWADGRVQWGWAGYAVLVSQPASQPVSQPVNHLCTLAVLSSTPTPTPTPTFNVNVNQRRTQTDRHAHRSSFNRRPLPSLPCHLEPGALYRANAIQTSGIESYLNPLSNPYLKSL